MLVCVRRDGQITCRSRLSPSTRWSRVVYSLTFLFRISLVFFAGLKDKLVHSFRVNKARRVFLTAEGRETLTSRRRRASPCERALCAVLAAASIPSRHAHAGAQGVPGFGAGTGLLGS